MNIRKLRCQYIWIFFAVHKIDLIITKFAWTLISKLQTINFGQKIEKIIVNNLLNILTYCCKTLACICTKGRILWTEFCGCVNPFFPNVAFLYPLKTSEIRKVFWCFQGVQKRCIGNEWLSTSCLKVWNVSFDEAREQDENVPNYEDKDDNWKAFFVTLLKSFNSIVLDYFFDK